MHSCVAFGISNIQNEWKGKLPVSVAESFGSLVMALCTVKMGPTLPNRHHRSVLAHAYN